jgi:hypothetical protein
MKATQGSAKIIVLVISCALPLLAAFAAAASSTGTVTGHVQAPDGEPIIGVTVSLKNDITGFSASSVTDKTGAFVFLNVPLNPYTLSVKAPGFLPLEKTLEIRSAVIREVTLRLEIEPVTSVVTVSASTSSVQLETDTASSHVDIDKSFIAKAPATVASRAMEEIITATPGFAKDENGRFHFQGAHSQSEYVIDGQTVSDQMGTTFSNSIDPGIVQSIEVVYGGIPAEYGEKTGAVFNLATKSGLGSGSFKGEAYFGNSRFSTYEAEASGGFGSDTFGLFASVNASESARFLDPVNFDNAHNRGQTFRGFLRADWAAGKSDRFRFTVLSGLTDRDVPNTTTQQLRDQNQRVRTRDMNISLGWQHFLSWPAVIDVTIFGRLSDFDLNPSAGDWPVRVVSRRHLDNFGFSPSLTWVAGNHEIKAGLTFKTIPIGELFEFGLTDPDSNAPDSPGYDPALAPYDLTRGGALFHFSARRTGTYFAAYVQDTIRLHHLTANIGLRYDHNNLPASEGQLEPRIGIAYHIPSTRTVLRASYNRLFYTPEFENILFSSSSAAAALAPPEIRDSRPLGGGLLLVRSERQDAFTVGAQQAIGRWLRLDVDGWWRRSTNAGDQDQFLNTGIVFPLAFSKGRLHGWDARLDIATTSRLRGYLSIGHTRAIYYGPPVGGLFLQAEALDQLTGGPFLIDHDQDIQLQGGATYSLPRAGLWLGGNVRFDSGLVMDVSPEDLGNDPDNAFAIPYIRVHSGAWNDPNRVAPRTIWNFSAGFESPWARFPVTVQLDVLNAFDRKGVYNILSIFGGTHVIPPRIVAVRVRYHF